MKWLRNLLGEKSSSPSVPEAQATLKKEAGNLYVLRIGGRLNKATVDNIQAIAARDITGGATNLKVLIVLSNFRGWRRSEDWADLEFFARYGQTISRIAVVCDPRWKTDTELLLGAGRRQADLRHFAPEEEIEAREWLYA